MFGQQISRREKCFRNYNNNNNNCIQLGKVSIETLKTNKYRNGRKPAFSRSLCAIELNWASMRCAIEKAHNLCHLWATNIISIQPVRYIQWFVATVKREHTHAHNELTISNAFHIWYCVRYSRNIETTTKKRKTTHFTTLMTYLHMQCRPPSSDGSVLRKCTNETTIKQKTMHESHCQLNTTPIDMTCNENRFFISDHLNYTAILVVFSSSWFAIWLFSSCFAIWSFSSCFMIRLFSSCFVIRLFSSCFNYTTFLIFDIKLSLNRT